MRPNRPSSSLHARARLLAALLLPLLASALPHGDDHGSMDMGSDMHGGAADTSVVSSAVAAATATATPDTQPSSPTTYFTYDKHFGSILAHIVLMFVAWFFVLPLGAYSGYLLCQKETVAN